MSYVVSFIIGSLAWLALKGWNILLNRDRRPLSSTEKEVMRTFFPDIELGQVRIAEDAILLAPPGKHAMVIGHDIFWEGKLTICDPDEGTTDARRLMHELVHVRQVERLGSSFMMVVSYTRAVLLPGNDLEEEADAFTAQHAEELEERRQEVCASGDVAEDDWDWLLYG